jgi:hypothetical protein
MIYAVAPDSSTIPNLGEVILGTVVNFWGSHKFHVMFSRSDGLKVPRNFRLVTFSNHSLGRRNIASHHDID